MGVTIILPRRHINQLTKDLKVNFNNGNIDGKFDQK